MGTHLPVSATTIVPREVAKLTLPTPFGGWETHAFEWEGSIHLCLCRGRMDDGEDVLVRMHSECVTGDALGSLRCDCGIQLRHAFRTIAAEGRGVLVYSTGHEGRGIGLANKLRAYLLQDRGLDTAEANEHLGFRVDERTFGDVAACLRILGVRSVRLMSNNRDKAAALESAGIPVRAVVGLPTAAHARNVRYLSTKQVVMGHEAPMGMPLAEEAGPPPDVGSLLGEVRASKTRPYVVVKYAQTIDGRIATSTGDARWISGEEERRTSHALRAGCDAVLVGVGTILADDPRLTVRLVPGASPIRVVLDPRLRIPGHARVLEDEGVTTIVTTGASSAKRRAELRRRGGAAGPRPAFLARGAVRRGDPVGARGGRSARDHVLPLTRARRSARGGDRAARDGQRDRLGERPRDHGGRELDPARAPSGPRRRRGRPHRRRPARLRAEPSTP